jgi:hypothetical protein
MLDSVRHPDHDDPIPWEVAARIFASYRLYAEELQASSTRAHAALAAEQHTDCRFVRLPPDDRERA